MNTPDVVPVAWVDVADSHEGPYVFHGDKFLPRGKNNLFSQTTVDALQARIDELASNPHPWKGALEGTILKMGERIDELEADLFIAMTGDPLPLRLADEMSTDKADAREAYVARGEQLMYTLKRAVRNDHDDVSTKADCEALQAAHTALVDHLRTTPEGYVLFPVEPTPAILACIELEWLANGSSRKNYASLIAAAQEGK